MAGWRVDYEESETEVKSVFITLSDEEYQTAQAVETAIEKGKIPGVRIKTGAMVLVRKHNPATMGERT